MFTFFYKKNKARQQVRRRTWLNIPGMVTITNLQWQKFSKSTTFLKPRQGIADRVTLKFWKHRRNNWRTSASSLQKSSSLDRSEARESIQYQNVKTRSGWFSGKWVRGIFGILETPFVHCMPYHVHGQPLRASNWGPKCLEKAGSHCL